MSERDRMPLAHVIYDGIAVPIPIGVEQRAPKGCQFKDRAGEKFSRWAAVMLVGFKRGRAFWLWKCDCGSLAVVEAHAVACGLSKSCGCLQRESVTTHGASYSPEYHTWLSIIARCFNKNATRYSDWGGRGITMCDEWRESFEMFFAHVGPRPSSSHSIDRIDNDGNYEPGNVRWATPAQQASNRRRTNATL